MSNTRSNRFVHRPYECEFRVNRKNVGAETSERVIKLTDDAFRAININRENHRVPLGCIGRVSRERDPHIFRCINVIYTCMYVCIETKKKNYVDDAQLLCAGPLEYHRRIRRRPCDI